MTKHQHESWQIQDGPQGRFCAACGESVDPVDTDSAQHKIENFRLQLSTVGADMATLALELHRAGKREAYGEIHEAINKAALAMNRLSAARRILEAQDV